MWASAASASSAPSATTYLRNFGTAFHVLVGSKDADYRPADRRALLQRFIDTDPYFTSTPHLYDDDGEMKILARNALAGLAK